MNSRTKLPGRFRGIAGQARDHVRQAVSALLGQRGRAGESGRRDTRPAIGVEAVINTAFEQRPRQPKRSRRPYAFGSKQARHQYYQSASLILDAYARQSERFRAGRYNVSFPPGTYRPPAAMAA